VEIKKQRRTNKIQGYADHPFARHSPTIDDLVYAFRLDCQSRKLAPRTITCYEDGIHYLQNIFAEQNRPFYVTTVTTSDLQKHFIGYMVSKKLAPQTINGRLGSCKAFFKFLFHERYVKENIAQPLKNLRTPKDAIQTFTKAELLTLLKQPDQSTFTGFRDYTLQILLLETGIRISELLALTVDDVHLSEKELIVRNGKGNKTRIVPFQKTCAKVLQKYLKERGNVPTDALFITIDNMPLQLRSVQDRIRDYGLRAKISGVRVSPHTFRHTMAKLYIRNGGDPFSLQQILGHSSLDSVQMYVRLFSNEVKEQHRKYSPVEHMKARWN